jgi:Holliday junction DNA helicase RuvB
VTGAGGRRKRAKAAAGFRPSRLSEVVGQHEAVGALQTAVSAALERGDMPGHVLLCGPAGTGKTTLALCIANEMRGSLTELFGVGLRGPGDLVSPLANLERKGVLFIDEIHRAWRPALEAMYPVMEDGRLPLPNAQVLELPRFGRGGPLAYTVIGATTDPERLTTPMLDRFALIVRLRLYTVDELVGIATRAAGVLGVEIEPAAAFGVAQASAGVPRVAIRLVRAARDYAVRGTITAESVAAVLSSTALIWRTEGRDAG